jgi:hypothetical protein
MTGTRGSGRWRQMMTGTFRGVKRPKRKVEVVRQMCHSKLRQWHLGLVPRAVERCLKPKVLEARRRCPATKGCIRRGPGVIPG